MSDTNPTRRVGPLAWLGIGPIVDAPRRRGGITAAGAVMSKRKIENGSYRKTIDAAWQEDGWSMFDLVGEHRFLTTTLSERIGKAHLYVGTVNHQGDEPTPVDPAQEPLVTHVLDALGDGPLGLGTMIVRLAANLFVAGEGWIVGVPPQLIPEASVKAVLTAHTTPTSMGLGGEELDRTIDGMVWMTLAQSEVVFEQSGVRIKLGEGADADIVAKDVDDLWMMRVWRPHPRKWWASDSPTRSSLPVLREIVGLTMHVSANIDSRLAGAGVLLVPASASRAMKIAAGLSEDSDEDPLMDVLLDTMLTPIKDRSAASAVVPIAVTVPDESIDKWKQLTFSTPLDASAGALRNEAIRRLALGLDAPPELLLGTADSNYWSAWLTAEDTVSSHIEPPLALICETLTTQYLRPILEANGFTRQEAEKYVVWYDVSHMIVRPNRGEDARAVYALGALSDEALRDSNGFDESDAPKEMTDDPAVNAVFQMVKLNPALVLNPGLDVLYDQVKALLAGKPLGSIGGNNPTDGAAVATAGGAVVDPNAAANPQGTGKVAKQDIEVGSNGVIYQHPEDFPSTGPRKPGSAITSGQTGQAAPNTPKQGGMSAARALAGTLAALREEEATSAD